MASIRRRDRPLQGPVPTESQAWSRILWWLGLRARTVHETERKLGEWGVDDAIRDRLIARLTELKLLDDNAFASALAQELARKGLRGVAVRDRLLRRGVPSGPAADAVRSVEPEDAGEAALALARKRAAHAGMTVPRLGSWLLRRGYRHAEAFEAASQAMRELLPKVSE